MPSSPNLNSTSKLYIVEHLDPELEAWSAMEYLTIAAETEDAGAVFCLSSISKDLKLPAEFHERKKLRREERSVEDWCHADKSCICLLDPAATTELSPNDGLLFHGFLFGGILGTPNLPTPGAIDCGQTD